MTNTIKKLKKHICCDGECNHDDCCGKILENCPNLDFINPLTSNDPRAIELVEQMRKTLGIVNIKEN